jgi:hypothetical protein
LQLNLACGAPGTSCGIEGYRCFVTFFKETPVTEFYHV